MYGWPSALTYAVQKRLILVSEEYRSLDYNVPTGDGWASLSEREIAILKSRNVECSTSSNLKDATSWTLKQLPFDCVIEVNHI
jgi:hypothetical protein